MPLAVHTTPAHAAQTVTVRSVSRTFPTPTGPRPVLVDVDLTVEAGEIVAVLGASGCGKSTLLRQIGGLDTPDVGSVRIADGDVVGIDPRTAIAFQEPRLLPWRTLAQNVRLGLPRGTPRDVATARVAHLLDLVGLSASARLRPREVSGGMAQRASLARALARNPAVLLLDEPFGALDALTRLKMQDLLLTIHAAEPTTVVLVTHDVDEALVLADRVVLLGPVGAAESLRAADSDAQAGVDAGSPARTGQSVRAVVAVPGPRPRDHADPRLADLRTRLLHGLGVVTHSAVGRPAPPRSPEPRGLAPAGSVSTTSVPATSVLVVPEPVIPEPVVPESVVPESVVTKHVIPEESA